MYVTNYVNRIEEYGNDLHRILAVVQCRDLTYMKLHTNTQDLQSVFVRVNYYGFKYVY